MWHIDHNGVARATYGGGRHIVVRRAFRKVDPWPNHYEVIVEGKSWPYTYEGRDAAMRLVESVFTLDGDQGITANGTSQIDEDQ